MNPHNLFPMRVVFLLAALLRHIEQVADLLKPALSHWGFLRHWGAAEARRPFPKLPLQDFLHLVSVQSADADILRWPELDAAVKMEDQHRIIRESAPLPGSDAPPSNQVAALEESFLMNLGSPEEQDQHAH
jgi:hypothetical protein